MPHISGFSSAVDHAPELALAVGRRAKPPARELGRKASENLAVREPLALQSAMAAAYELLGPLVEERQHLVDQPDRLGLAQPRRAHQVGYEVLELARLRHAAKDRPIWMWRAIGLPDFGQNELIRTTGLRPPTIMSSVPKVVRDGAGRSG